jgi:hypothetical protein
MINFKSTRNYTKYRFYQESLITFFYIQTLFFSILTIYSLTLNNILTMKAAFIVSQFFALCGFVGSVIYLFIWVQPHLAFEFYKVHNFFRAISVLIIIVNKYGGIIMLNIVELLALGYDIYYLNKFKINKFLNIIDHVMIAVAFNSAVFFEDFDILSALLGLSLYSVLLIKAYYVLSGYLSYR